jgi:hypothetical protein
LILSSEDFKDDIYHVIHMYAPEVILLLEDKKWHTWWFGVVVIEKLASQGELLVIHFFELFN